MSDIPPGFRIQLLVPRRDETGQVRYQRETRWVQLRRRRQDQEALLKRLGEAER